MSDDEDKLFALTLAALANSALVKHSTDVKTIVSNAILIAQQALKQLKILKALNDTNH